ncbi:MAG: hypothetical protein HZB23_01305 [Deltaproteobacteria bacterium]|nr:hypothetical protein [Deltaproteobacteria bacterium]
MSIFIFNDYRTNNNAGFALEGPWNQGKSGILRLLLAGKYMERPVEGPGVQKALKGLDFGGEAGFGSGDGNRRTEILTI